MSRTTKQQSKTPKMVKVAASARPAKDLGICATCNEAPTCVNLKASKQPIWHCDQFDDYVPPAGITAGATKPAPLRTEQPTNGGFEGLCRHCAHRATCVNRTAGVAVWHCEEYS